MEGIVSVLPALGGAQASLAAVVGVAALKCVDDRSFQQFAECLGEHGGLVVTPLLFVSERGGHGYQCGGGKIAVQFGGVVPEFGERRCKGGSQVVGVVVLELVNELHVALIAAQG